MVVLVHMDIPAGLAIFAGLPQCKLMCVEFLLLDTTGLLASWQSLEW